VMAMEPLDDGKGGAEEAVAGRGIVLIFEI
jgi:hypothetical protein